MKKIVFAIDGDLLSTTASPLRSQLSALMERGPFELLEIDLRAASMVDSVGLNFLVWALKLARRRGAGLRVRVSSADIQRTFRFTRLTSYIDIALEPAG